MADVPITPIIVPKPLETPPQAILADLEHATITLIITLMDDSEVTLPMKMLPQYRMMELTTNIPDPLPPIKDYKLPGGDPIYDFNDKTYIADRERATFNRNSAIIAESLLIDIPGETVDAKAAYVREKFDTLVLEQIVLALQMQRQKAKARIVARAATFPR